MGTAFGSYSAGKNQRRYRRKLSETGQEESSIALYYFIEGETEETIGHKNIIFGPDLCTLFLKITLFYRKKWDENVKVYCVCLM